MLTAGSSLDLRKEEAAPALLGPGALHLQMLDAASGSAPAVEVPGLAALPRVAGWSGQVVSWLAASTLVHGLALAALIHAQPLPLSGAPEEIPVEIVVEASASASASETPAMAETPPENANPDVQTPSEPEQKQASVPIADEPPTPEPTAEPSAAQPPFEAPEPATAMAEPAPEPVPEPPVAVPRPAAAPKPVARPQPKAPAAPATRPKPAHPAPVREAVRQDRQARAEHVASVPAAVAARTPVATPTGADLAAWRASVLGRLRAEMRYPDNARARGASGQASIAFAIDAGGRVTSASLTRSSGEADLDAEALAIVRRASPFSPPPPGAPRRLSAPITFQLR
jgi:TonB family protein